MKQTAVEWLVEQLRMQTPLYTKDEIINEAKEMEKKQIIDAYKEAITNGFYDEDAEQYYNETFKNK